MIDKEMLEAIGTLMDSKLEPIRADIIDLKQGQAKLEHNQDAMKADIIDLAHGLAAVVDHQAIIEKDIRSISQTMAVFESKLKKDMEIIKEGIAGWGERKKQIDRHEQRLDNHSARVFALEQAVKK